MADDASNSEPAARTTQLKALWVSTSLQTRGGVASYVRDIRQTPLWTDWNIRHVATHRDGSGWTKIAAFVAGASAFASELILCRPDLVHLHTSADASFVRKSILFWISQLARVPVVLHVHDSTIQEFYENSPSFLQALIRRTLVQADTVVALGETWAARLRAIAPDARIAAIPNGVRPATPVRQAGPGEPVRIVFLGRIGDWKGTFRLLEALALIEDPRATLSIAGDGEVAAARRLVTELGLQAQVEVHDWLSPEAVGELLNRSHVLALPSRNEGQPMAVLEAMARGMCVLASDAGGLAEMIGGGCGVIVSPFDVDSIAAGLRRVITDSELRARCGAAAFERVADRYDVNAVARRLDSLYRELTARTVPAAQLS